MNWTLRFLCLLFFTALAPAARAQAGTPGAFDFYLFSLSLAPSYCALTPAPQTKPDCTALTEAAFEQTPLTIHGLWPNRRNVSPSRQPSNCSHVPAIVSDPVEADLKRFMPGGWALQAHEWAKHGTCSGLIPDAYFATAVGLATQADNTIGSVLREKNWFGQQVKVEDLVAAVAAKDRAVAAAMQVDCQQAAGGGQMMIDEIRLTLSKAFRPVPTTSVGLRQNAGCPAEGALIPLVPQ